MVVGSIGYEIVVGKFRVDATQFCAQLDEICLNNDKIGRRGDL